jgi:hypothetical protein
MYFLAFVVLLRQAPSKSRYHLRFQRIQASRWTDNERNMITKLCFDGIMHRAIEKRNGVRTYKSRPHRKAHTCDGTDQELAGLSLVPVGHGGMKVVGRISERKGRVDLLGVIY